MTSKDTTLKNLLKTNEMWAQAVADADPEFFRRSAEGQSPQVLWIGCSDSRVPESVVTGSKPGDLFVHRNIANQVNCDDDSVLSVVTYAVDYLKVKHVIVVGHSNCGGALACVRAAGAPPQPVDNPLYRWLAPLTDLARSLKVNLLDEGEALSLLVKENVRQQLKNLAEMDTVKNALKRGDVQIHGWLYELSSGRLSDLGMP